MEERTSSNDEQISLKIDSSDGGSQVTHKAKTSCEVLGEKRLQNRRKPFSFTLKRRTSYAYLSPLYVYFCNRKRKKCCGLRIREESKTL